MSIFEKVVQETRQQKKHKETEIIQRQIQRKKQTAELLKEVMDEFHQLQESVH